MTALNMVRGRDTTSSDGDWRWTDVALCLLLAATLSYGIAMALQALGETTGLDLVEPGYWPGSRGALIGEALQRFGPVLAVWLLFARRGSKRRRPLGLRRASDALAVSVAAAIGGLLIGVKGVLALIASEHPGLVPVQIASHQFGPPAPELFTGWGLSLTLLTAGVVAALAEELVYRGVVFGWLRQRFGILTAVAVSAVVFALVHPPAAMPFAFAAGLLLAWLYHRSNSLWPGIALHGINNITTMLVLASVARA